MEKLMTKAEYEQKKKDDARKEVEREFQDKKLGAIDNLWIAKDDLRKYELVGKKPRKMKQTDGSKFDDNWHPKNEKVEGVMVFYIPRDEKGKPSGEPKKYLQIYNKGSYLNVFIDGEKIEPYYIDVHKKNGAGYTANELTVARKRLGLIKDEPKIDNTAIASKFSGSDLLDMSNADGLDSSIINTYSNLTNESLLSNAGGCYGFTNESLLGFTNESLLGADGDDYSNLTNESLLGFTNESLLGANGERKRRILRKGGRLLNLKAIANKTAPKLVRDEKGKWVAQGSFNQGETKNVVNIRFVKNKNGKRAKMLIFSDKTASLAPFWNKIREKKSNLTNESLLGFTNESLLGADGDDYSNLTNESLLGFTNESLLGFTNESLLGADGDDYSNLTNESLLGFTNESLLGANGEDYSNGIGDWFKKLKAKRQEKKALKKLSEPTTDVVSAQTMVEAHKESGSTKPFKEWMQSDGGRNFLNSLTGIASILINQPKSSTTTSGGSTSTGTSTGKVDSTPSSSQSDERETKILGMNPITFGLVSVGAIAVVSVIAVKLMKR